jgi:hypothetical protein
VNHASQIAEAGLKFFMQLYDIGCPGTAADPAGQPHR